LMCSSGQFDFTLGNGLIAVPDKITDPRFYEH
jgi:hypothetical protein